MDAEWRSGVARETSVIEHNHPCYAGVCAPERTSAEWADQGDARQRDFLGDGNVDRLG
jgi:hypothetical protein